MSDRVTTRGDGLAISAAVIVVLTTVLYVTIIVSQGERAITRVGFVVLLLVEVWKWAHRGPLVI